MRRQRFVGRNDERTLFRSALAASPLPFNVLHVVGPGGVGKTTLLRELAQDAERAGAAVPDPLHDTAAAETRVAVRRALATIPPEQRRTLEMAYYGGMSQNEIAAATGESLGTVKTRTRLGLQRLRGLLAPAV